MIPDDAAAAPLEFEFVDRSDGFLCGREFKILRAARDRYGLRLDFEVRPPLAHDKPWFWYAEGVDRDGLVFDDGGGSWGPLLDGTATAVAQRLTLAPSYVVTEVRVRVRSFHADRLSQEMEFYDLVVRQPKDATTTDRTG